MNRAKKRARQRAIKKIGKKGTDMERKIGLFDMMPEGCSACMKPFDKKDKEMVSTWSVVVREEEHSVRLYCPECWTLAQNIIEEWKGKLNEKD